MNRTIKFRAWDGKRMITVNHNYYLSFSGKSIAQITEPMAVDIRHFGSTDRLHYKDLKNYTLMQFTGLQDKNGKDVFENDLVKCCVDGDCSIHQVVWGGEHDSGYPAFDLVPYVEVESNGISHFNATGTIEVIGSIYESPELLED